MNEVALWEAVAVAGGATGAVVALAYVIAYRARARRGTGLTRVPGDVERWKAQTPVGPAYVTRVMHPDKGEVFQIRTDFYRRPGDTGPMARIHYVPRALARADAEIARLALAHQDGQPQTGETP